MSTLLNNVEMDDASKDHIGMKVKTVFRDLRLGMITGFYFVPVTV